MAHKTAYSSIARLAALAAAALTSSAASAAIFPIANGDVAALISAINLSNSNNQDDVINLAAGGVYTLTVVNNTTLGNTGLPVIASDNSHALTINGNGSTIQRSGANGTPTFRIFLVACATQCPSKQTTFNNLIIQRGAAVSGNGGAIDVDFDGDVTLNNCIFTNNFAENGGAVSNGGDLLTLSNCTFTDNQAHGGGGAVINANTLAATNCTFSGNNTIAGPGGALYNFGNYAEATATNCTFDNNTRNPGGGIEGGGIFNNISTSGVGATVALMTLTHCTFRQTNVLNSGTYTGGLAPTGVLTLRNCLFSASALVNSTNPGHNRVEIRSQGYNLSSGDGGGNLTGPNDQINTNPRLDPAGLQDNGGPTATIALLAESPAIDRGSSFGLTTDQRGQLRPRDLAFAANGAGSDGSDIGAFEAIDPPQGGPAFLVNTAADHDDGSCSGPDCSLREAVFAANAAVDANSINFAPNVTGMITLGSSLGQLIVSNPVSINGPGARLLAISGGAATRVFAFTNGTSVLAGLTVRDGRVAALSFSIPAFGGALSNSAALTVNDCAFVANQVVGGPNNTGGIQGTTGGTGRGGAIGNLAGAVLTVNRSTFSGNSATGGRGFNSTGSGVFGGTGGRGDGAALVNDAGGTAAINNCTFAGNTATGGPGGNNISTGGRGGTGGASGGAVVNRDTITVTASTFSGNTGVGGSGGQGATPRDDGNAGQASGALENIGSATCTLRNTISAANTGNGGPDVKGAFVSQGFNLIGVADFGSGFNASGDQIGSSAAPLQAVLGALSSNGGPTDTIALLTGSPAIDQGNSFGLTTDQRGQPRPSEMPGIANFADGSDIGAYEASLLFVRVIQIARNGGPMNIQFQGTQGRTFRLERKLAITDATWQRWDAAGEVGVDVSGHGLLIDASAGSQVRAFYRVVLVTSPF